MLLQRVRRIVRRMAARPGEREMEAMAQREEELQLVAWEESGDPSAVPTNEVRLQGAKDRHVAWHLGRKM